MAHELGHNLNMKHDYLEETVNGAYGIRYDSRGQRCSYLQTIMDTQVDFFIIEHQTWESFMNNIKIIISLN